MKYTLNIHIRVVMRRSSERLMLSMLEGHIEGSRRPGWPRRWWMDDIGI